MGCELLPATSRLLPYFRFRRSSPLSASWLFASRGVPLCHRSKHELIAPLVPLSASDLLVNARGEPALAREIPSADSVDLLCAFVRWHGLRLLETELKAHCAAGRRLRVITTVFTGSTERKAIDWLVGLGAEVKVSYGTQSTRLHAKAWMFRRATGYSTAYIGSSNLSKVALVDGERFAAA